MSLGLGYTVTRLPRLILTGSAYEPGLSEVVNVDIGHGLLTVISTPGSPPATLAHIIIITTTSP